MELTHGVVEALGSHGAPPVWEPSALPSPISTSPPRLQQDPPAPRNKEMLNHACLMMEPKGCWVPSAIGPYKSPAPKRTPPSLFQGHWPLGVRLSFQIG